MSWKPIFYEGENKYIVEKKLSKIAEELSTLNRQNSNYGLFNGCEGIILFFLYYSRLTNNKDYLHYAINLLEDLFNSLNHRYFSFSGGLGGLCWLINHIYVNKFAESDTDNDNVLAELDEFLQQSMMNEIERGNYDFMHGALGIGLYFISRGKKSEILENFLKELIYSLEKFSVQEADGTVKWYSFKNQMLIRHYCDLGLAHGISSIIVFLAKAFQAKTTTASLQILLEKSCNYLLKQQFYRENHLSCFPHFVLSNNEITSNSSSRLAWCYGDLGICCALWQASEAMDNGYLRDEVNRILTINSKRRDLSRNGIWDASLCHGTSGVAHIFLRMYNSTGDVVFKDTSEYWYQETLKMARFKDNISGYKSFDPVEMTYNNNYGLIEGIAGTGLALIASISNFPPLWDNCMFLS